MDDGPSLLVGLLVPPGTLGTLFLCNQFTVRVGRRYCCSTFMGLCAAFTLFATVAPGLRYLLAMCTVMIRCLGAAALVIAHVFAVELMPTLGRGTSIGMLYTVVNLGQLMIVLLLNSSGQGIVLIICFVISTIAAVLPPLLLPDTRGKVDFFMNAHWP